MNKSRRNALAWICSPFAFAFGMTSVPASAQTRYTLTTAEQRVVTSLGNVLRELPVPDGHGGFNQTASGNYPGAPVWISVYHCHFIALALLAEYDRTRNPKNLELVRRWLEFCPNTQGREGYFEDMAGTLSNYKRNGYIDAWDSAALYIVVCHRFRNSGGTITPRMLTCAKKVLTCVRSLTDVDGLTWGKPGYPVKLAEDQMEVYAGLDAGQRFFRAVGAVTEANQCAAQVAKMKISLPKYFDSQKQIYSWALHSNGVYNTTLDKLYADAQCNLLCLANIAPRSTTWNALKAKFQPDDQSPYAVAGSELWLLAASRMTTADRTAWRAKVVNVAGRFTSTNVYGYRAAWALLALTEGASYMPSIQSPAR